MVSGAKIDGAPQILSAGVRKTIQQIKEIVGNHSDADIYVALKETNMDPNETTQKLLNQDPFHEVRRRKDKKKENAGFRASAAAEPRRNSENVAPVTRTSLRADRNSRKIASNRSTLPDAGMSREFRVVRDNRVNNNSNTESKVVQGSTSVGEPESSNGYVKSSSSGTSVNEKLTFGRLGLQTTNVAADSQPRQVRGGSSISTAKEVSGETQQSVVSATPRTQAVKPPSTASSINSVIGVYSSSSDPVHVPSPDSRPAAKIGAIKREVGVVGANRQNYENSAKNSSSHGDLSSNSHLARDGTSSRESLRSSSTIVKSDPSSQTILSESTAPSLSTSRSFSSNQYNGRSHQLVGHQKAPQPNKEWKPKSTQKSGAANGPGVIGMAAQTASPVDNSNTGAEIAQVTDQVSRVNVAENENVIIASHIRVSETDRSRLTFGSLGTDLEPRTSVFQPAGNSEETYAETSESLPGSSAPEAIAKIDNEKHLELIDDHLRNSGSVSPASVSASEQRLLEKKETSTPENLDNYADLRLVRASSPSYVSPEVQQQQQDTAEIQSFSSYDPQTGYDMPYFRPVIEEPVRGQGLASPQEALMSHPTNNINSSSMAMLQQQQQLQQQALAQMYQQPHLRVSPFPTNMMPYRQYISPVYVPQMPMSAYSGNGAYPHPSNGNSYMLMTGNSSHLDPSSGVKFGIQQFKPLPGGSPVFGNFTNPSGYAVSTPGVVGNPAGLEDSSRLKYKDGNLYVPTPPAETSEIWMNPRDMQSASYYNVAQQTHHAAYLPTHSGHAPFNAAAAVAQSSHMPFQGLYHPPPQPAGIGNPHHLGPAVGGNIGVGVAAVAGGAQVGTYQQPQIGHQNWTGNF